MLQQISCFLFVFLFSWNLFAKESICLNMIVKDETAVIERCLNSVKPLIDYWVIVDTGSTDGTQEKIRECMRGVPGELHKRLFVNFEVSRNEAMDLAKDKGDYLLFIDADEKFEYEDGFSFPRLTANCYHINTILGGMTYARALLVKNDAGFRWRGAVHEALYGNEPIERKPLLGIQNHSFPEGSRSKAQDKFQQDASLLNAYLKEHPNDRRTVFYLAQSYRDSGDLEKAKETYQKRISLGGWDEEVYYSRLQIAHLNQKLKEDHETILKGYFDAFQFRPTRKEPLYYLANYLRLRGDLAASYTILSLSERIPKSSDMLFVETWIDDYGLALEKSVAAYWLHKYQESKELSLRILDQKDLPQKIRELVLKNLQFTDGKLEKRVH